MANAVSNTCVKQVNPHNYSTHILRYAFARFLEALQTANDAQSKLDRVTGGDRFAVYTSAANKALRNRECAWDAVANHLRETAEAADRAPPTYAVRKLVSRMQAVLTSLNGEEFRQAVEAAFTQIETSRTYLSESARDRDTRHLLSMAFERLEELEALPFYDDRPDFFAAAYKA